MTEILGISEALNNLFAFYNHTTRFKCLDMKKGNLAYKELINKECRTGKVKTERILILCIPILYNYFIFRRINKPTTLQYSGQSEGGH